MTHDAHGRYLDIIKFMDPTEEHPSDGVTRVLTSFEIAVLYGRLLVPR